MCKSPESPLHQSGLISKPLLHSVISHYSPPHSKASSLQSDLWKYIHRSRVLDRAQLLPSYLQASLIRLWSEEFCPYITSKKTRNSKRTNSIWRCDTAFPYFPRWTSESHCCSCQEGNAERELSKLRHFRSALFSAREFFLHIQDCISWHSSYTLTRSIHFSSLCSILIHPSRSRGTIRTPVTLHNPSFLLGPKSSAQHRAKFRIKMDKSWSSLFFGNGLRADWSFDIIIQLRSRLDSHLKT